MESNRSTTRVDPFVLMARVLLPAMFVAVAAFYMAFGFPPAPGLGWFPSAIMSMTLAFLVADVVPAKLASNAAAQLLLVLAGATAAGLFLGGSGIPAAIAVTAGYGLGILVRKMGDAFATLANRAAAVTPNQNH